MKRFIILMVLGVFLVGTLSLGAYTWEGSTGSKGEVEFPEYLKTAQRIRESIERMKIQEGQVFAGQVLERMEFLIGCWENLKPLFALNDDFCVEIVKADSEGRGFWITEPCYINLDFEGVSIWRSFTNKLYCVVFSEDYYIKINKEFEALNLDSVQKLCSDGRVKKLLEKLVEFTNEEIYRIIYDELMRGN